MLRIIKNTKIWFAFSGLLVAVSMALFFVWGLKPGLDFTGGSLSELEFQENVNSSEVREVLAQNGFLNILVQPVSDKILIIKTEPLEQSRLEKLKSIIADRFGPSQERRFESIGPAISRELVQKAYFQIALVVFGILLYIAYAFRKAGQAGKNAGLSSWRMGLAAIIALLHDLLITVGLFVILGRYRGVEIDSLFITALLTILGFSVHDTIVVFDRIRENLQKYAYKSLEAIIEFSVDSTLARSINTSSTLIFVLAAMLLFGGQTIFNFVLALLVGVTVGTYSSIFIASPLLYYWPTLSKGK